ncbi:MAG: hypothetical protein ABIB71_01870 [Candidatus Woesearchaeota archaeon]
MVSYNIDWSRKTNAEAWGCSDNRRYHAVFGISKNEYSLFKRARMCKKYKFSSKTLDLKLYAFFVAEHIILIRKKVGIKDGDYFIICPDRPGHHADVINLTLDFLTKRGIHLNKECLKIGSSKGSLAHVFANSFVKKSKIFPKKIHIKKYAFKEFDIAIGRKRKKF